MFGFVLSRSAEGAKLNPVVAARAATRNFGVALVNKHYLSAAEPQLDSPEGRSSTLSTRVILCVALVAFSTCSCWGETMPSGSFWTDDQIKASNEVMDKYMLGRSLGPERVTKRLNIRPTFYRGPMEFDVLLYRAPQVGHEVQQVTVFSNRFKEWNTIFMYLDQSHALRGVPVGARTVYEREDGLRFVVAEARIKKHVLGPEPSFIIEERHFNDNGDVVFACESIIDVLGFKSLEQHAVGRKEQDYYGVFLSPLPGVE